jgi:F-type H+-transporting ATPase subunit b
MWLLLLAARWPEEGAHEHAQPIIDLDNTVLVQFGLFLVMMLILHYALFKPFLRARLEREDHIDGERKRARDMEEAAQAKIIDLEGKLERSKQAGISLREGARKQAAVREQQILESARTESARLVETQRAAIARAGETARGKLRGSADDWARRLASRILGREVA